MAIVIPDLPEHRAGRAPPVLCVFEVEIERGRASRGLIGKGVCPFASNHLTPLLMGWRYVNAVARTHNR